MKKSWKPNCFTPTFGNFLIKNGFKRCEEGKSWISDDGYEVQTNYKKREFIFTFSDGHEKFFKTQTELKDFITNTIIK